MRTNCNACISWGIRLFLALAGCAWLGALTFQPARACGALALSAAIATSAGDGAPTAALALAPLSQPHQPELFDHRADGWPRAALLLIFVLISQILILAFRRLFRRR